MIFLKFMLEYLKSKCDSDPVEVEHSINPNLLEILRKGGHKPPIYSSPLT